MQRLRADLEEREAHLRAQEEELKQRDAEINRLLGELRRCQTQLQEQQGEVSQWRKGQPTKQTPLAELLRGSLKFRWKRGEDMPFYMTYHVQAVVIGDNVYVGGGYTPQSENKGVVMVYSLNTESWRTLPPYETEWFGMTAVNNQLVLVGGKVISSGKMTNVLAVWNEQSLKWTHPFPKMPTSRCLSSVVSYQKWILVAGGKDVRESRSDKVEILDTVSGQWYEGSPLPTQCSNMSSAINGNMALWYLSGGFSARGAANKQVFSVCLDELISRAVSQSAAGATSPSTPSPWHTLTNTPMTPSAILVLNGALLHHLLSATKSGSLLLVV